MTLKDFINKSKDDIDASIERVLGKGNHTIQTFAERRLWVLNDEGLYRWARRSGVRI